LLASKFDDIMNAPNSPINVKQLRASKKLTLRKIATTLDIAESTVGRWETGVNKPHLPLDKVKVLMDLFECDFDTLYGAFEQTWIEKDALVKKDLETDKRLLTTA
jgi:transcriptional regulator with XRE-family HTH domain